MSVCYSPHSLLWASPLYSLTCFPLLWLVSLNSPTGLHVEKLLPGSSEFFGFHLITPWWKDVKSFKGYLIRSEWQGCLPGVNLASKACSAFHKSHNGLFSGAGSYSWMLKRDPSRCQITTLKKKGEWKKLLGRLWDVLYECVITV